MKQNSFFKTNLSSLTAKSIYFIKNLLSFYHTCTAVKTQNLFKCDLSLLLCLFNLGWFAQDLLVWTPNILGSILFQISGSLALIEICKRWWCWNIRQLTWWIGAINFAGCVAFLVSAILAFTPPAPTNALIINWATTFTLIGAICFFAGAFLIWSTLDRKSD